MSDIIIPTMNSPTLDFSNTAIANDFSSSAGVSLPTGLPSNFTTPGNVATQFTMPATNATTTPTTSTASNSSGCSGLDLACWFGALVGRFGIVVLGMLMLGVGLWMLASKADIMPTVSVKA